MKPISLAPYAGEPEPCDPAFAGDWAEVLAAVRAEVQTPPWCSYLARRDETAVGLGGFKGAPSEGAVEIGYITFLDSRGSGVATALAGHLLEIARREGIALVCAHTLPEANASTRVLEANGFVLVGEVHDPEDGTVWRWARDLSE